MKKNKRKINALFAATAVLTGTSVAAAAQACGSEGNVLANIEIEVVRAAFSQLIGYQRALTPNLPTNSETIINEFQQTISTQLLAIENGRYQISSDSQGIESFSLTSVDSKVSDVLSQIQIEDNGDQTFNVVLRNINIQIVVDVFDNTTNNFVQIVFNNDASTPSLPFLFETIFIANVSLIGNNERILSIPPASVEGISLTNTAEGRVLSSMLTDLLNYTGDLSQIIHNPAAVDFITILENQRGGGTTVQRLFYDLSSTLITVTPAELVGQIKFASSSDFVVLWSDGEVYGKTTLDQEITISNIVFNAGGSLQVGSISNWTSDSSLTNTYQDLENSIANTRPSSGVPLQIWQSIDSVVSGVNPITILSIRENSLSLKDVVLFEVNSRTATSVRISIDPLELRVDVANNTPSTFVNVSLFTFDFTINNETATSAQVAGGSALEDASLAFVIYRLNSELRGFNGKEVSENPVEDVLNVVSFLLRTSGATPLGIPSSGVKPDNLRNVSFTELTSSNVQQVSSTQFSITISDFAVNLLLSNFGGITTSFAGEFRFSVTIDPTTEEFVSAVNMGPLIAYNGYSEDSVPVQDAIEAFNSPISSFLAGFQEGVDVTEYYSEEVGAAGSLDVVHNNVVSFLNAVAYFAQPNAGQSVSPISSVAFSTEGSSTTLYEAITNRVNGENDQKVTSFLYSPFSGVGEITLSSAAFVQNNDVGTVLLGNGVVVQLPSVISLSFRIIKNSNAGLSRNFLVFNPI